MSAGPSRPLVGLRLAIMLAAVSAASSAGQSLDLDPPPCKPNEQRDRRAQWKRERNRHRRSWR